MMFTALLEPVCGPPLANMTIDQAPSGTFVDATGQWCIDSGGLPPGAANVPSLDTVIDFVTNPLGYLAQQLALCAIWLLGIIAKWAVSSTQPDLTVEWWRQAYGRSLGVGLVLFGFVLVIQIARSNRGQGRDFMEDTAPWVMGFFFGVFAGPPLAQMMLNGFGYLSASIIEKWGGVTPGSGFQDINDALVAIVTQRGSAQAVGAIMLSGGLILAAFSIFISLCVQALIQYLASALFAIGFVWVLSKKHRQSAFKVPSLFLGVCASQPLMFFLMGIGFSIIKTTLFGDAGDIGRFIATVVMAISIFIICAFAPVLLLKFAPVLPTGSAESSSSGGGGGDVPRSSAAKGVRSSDGSNDSGTGGGSQTAKASRRSSPATSGASTGGGSVPAGGGTAVGAAAGAARGATTSGASRAGNGSGTPVTPGTSTAAGTPGGGSTGSSGPGGTGGGQGSASAGGGATPTPAGQHGRHRPGGPTGGTASPAMAKLAALAPHASAVAAGVSTVAGATARGRRRAYNQTKGTSGDQPWS